MRPSAAGFRRPGGRYGRGFLVGLVAGAAFAWGSAALLIALGLEEPFWGFQLRWAMVVPGAGVAAAAAAHQVGSSPLRILLLAWLGTGLAVLGTGTLWEIARAGGPERLFDSGWLLRRHLAASFVPLAGGSLLGTALAGGRARRGSGRLTRGSGG